MEFVIAHQLDRMQKAREATRERVRLSRERTAQEGI
jgi:hypothetical protein